MSASDERQLFTPDELARYLDLSIRTVRKILLDGKLPSHAFFKGARLVVAEDIDSYVAANRWTADFEPVATRQLDDGGYVAGEEVEPF